MTTISEAGRGVDTRPKVPAGARWLEWVWTLIGGVSVCTKILGIVLTLTIMLGLSVTWQVRAVMDQVFLDELDNRGLSVASDLAARSADPILLSAAGYQSHFILFHLNLPFQKVRVSAWIVRICHQRAESLPSIPSFRTGDKSAA